MEGSRATQTRGLMNKVVHKDVRGESKKTIGYVRYTTVDSTLEMVYLYFV